MEVLRRIAALFLFCPLGGLGKGGGGPDPWKTVVCTVVCTAYTVAYVYMCIRTFTGFLIFQGSGVLWLRRRRGVDDRVQGLGLSAGQASKQARHHGLLPGLSQLPPGASP
jgi:hypothetical protein